MTIRSVSHKSAEAVLQALIAQHPWCEDGDFIMPVLVENWTWSSAPAPYAILWEEGPFDWTYAFPHGGTDEEFGFKIHSSADLIPSDVLVEPITSWAVGIYPA